MAEALPDPLVPAEVDLRGYEYMPLDVVRLMRSSSWRKVRRQPELGYWMVNLWVSSWHEVPAASLPDDDDELADFARCEFKAWGKVKAKVLAGWVKCSDGRLYHPVVAEKALEAVAKMGAQKKQTHAAREARKQKLLQAAKEAAAAILTGTAAATVTEPVTSSNGEERRGEEQNREEPPLAEASPVVAASVPVEPPKAAAEDDDLVIPAFLRKSPKARADQDEAMAAWNAAADQHGWNRIDYLTSTRRFRLDRIFAICGGIDGFRAALDHAPTQNFLRTTGDGWQRWFNFDWLLDEDKFTRLMEGTYAKRHRDDNPDERSTAATLAGIAEAGSR